jgi:predicted lipoprotein with Yx(FWY)xxD motif
MKRFFSRHPKLALSITLVLVIVGLVGATASPALAATTAVVTVTGTPAYISITIAPTTYTINSDTGGNSGMNISTTYYSNPLGGTTSPSATVVDGECDFTISNTSSVAADYTGNMSDGSGGSNAMTNVNGATPGASSYAAYAYYSGETFTSKVLLKSSGSTLGNFKSNVSAAASLKVGFQFATQTGAWSGGTGSTYTLTITATVH